VEDVDKLCSGDRSVHMRRSISLSLLSFHIKTGS
jgi:hypothetical protein